MVRKFLYVIAALVVLAIAGAFAYRFYGVELMRMAMVPGERFQTAAPFSPAAYREQKMWLARPDLPGNPALWTPTGYTPRTTPGGAAVFFIHPTSYLSRAHWNAPVTDAEANARAALFLRGQASAFNAVGEIWAPRYRQATFGAFLTTEADADRALAFAYRDVAAAFDAFLTAIPRDRPVILAGHSQGALHLTRLLRERVATDPALKRRIVAAYVVGWPVSTATDLAALGLPACTAPAQRGCILSWQSFAEPADPKLVLDTYDATTGFDGKPRRGTPMLCTNPILGTPGTAPASANRGTLLPNEGMTQARIAPGLVPARCGERGLLLIGSPPEVGPYTLPGNNYHVYDYSLFWGDVRADAARRMAAQ
ncbi:hypothetical protein ASG29_10615 [Sphingomonas sp. Leaf412]|uniref:DUF3089 domain-containing protein n=1 Tax=Sphingomonas sp. Leaf412 TaxID=1736370 RepID=UPI0006F996F0|nr:DUF3089 domain-containing protein [Sphingomonas sp. Leaf412]KQT32263.1 hypothetical protein ASG29_10615 [Sphingomonas sp. Leaf412]